MPFLTLVVCFQLPSSESHTFTWLLRTFLPELSFTPTRMRLSPASFAVKTDTFTSIAADNTSSRKVGSRLLIACYPVHILPPSLVVCRNRRIQSVQCQRSERIACYCTK